MSTLKVTHLQNENGTGPAMSIAVGGGVTFAGITTFHGNVDLGSNSLEGSLQVATGATISGSTNTITGSTNGSERFRVSNDGTFRVGTDSSNVQIATNTGIDINDGAINLYQATSNANATPFLISTDVGGTETEKLRVTAGGDVGIGVTNPTSFGPTLQVAGTDPALLLQDTATAVDYFGINVQSGSVINWFDDSAYFAIGTASGLSGAAYSEKLRLTSDGATLGAYSTPSTNGTISSDTLKFIGSGWNTSSGAAEVGTILQSVHGYWSANYSNSYGQTYPDFKILIKNSDNATYDEKFAFSGNGVMRLISGGGINFNNYGTGTNIDSNLLDDYEEGTFTATMQSANNNATISTNNTTGYYIKVGGKVSFTYYTSTSSCSNAGTGGARLKGLPFTASNSSSEYWVCSVSHNGAFFSTTIDGGYVAAGSTDIVFQESNTTNTAAFAVGSNRYLMVSGTYSTV